MHLPTASYQQQFVRDHTGHMAALQPSDADIAFNAALLDGYAHEQLNRKLQPTDDSVEL